jgi:hypothetical protein
MSAFQRTNPEDEALFLLPADNGRLLLAVEYRDLLIQKPQLDVVISYQLLGPLLRRLIILAPKINTVHNMTVGTYNVGAVVLHRTADRIPQ